MCDYYINGYNDNKRDRTKNSWSSSAHEPASHERSPKETLSNSANRARYFPTRGRKSLRLLQSILCLPFSKDDSSLGGSPYFDNNFEAQPRDIPRTTSSSSLDTYSVHTMHCYDDPNLVPPDSRIPIICPIGAGRSFFSNPSVLRKLSPSSFFNKRSSRQI